MNKIFEFKNVSYVTSLKGNFHKRVLNNLSAEIQLPDDHGVVSIFSDDISIQGAILKLLSGLEKPTEGQITSAFKDPLLPFIQSGISTLPWLNVIENVTIPFGPGKAEVSESVRKAIEITELDGYETHYPSEKSRGFQFRIALARALAIEPPCILIEDPFAGCDRQVRDEIAQLLHNAAAEYKISIVLTTADHVQGIHAGEIYYWFYNTEISKLEQIIGADNVLSLIR